MRAMVLAAGLGTRLRPLTELLPKPLVPLLNRPMIGFALRRLHSAGIRDVIVNTHWLAPMVSETLGDGDGFGLRLTYSHEPELLGTGGGVRNVASFFGDETFVLLNGDAVVEGDHEAVIAAHRASGAAATLVLRGEGWRRYGAVGHDGAGRLLSLPGGRAPGAAARPHRAMFTGVHVIEPEVLRSLPPTGPSGIVRDGYAPLLATGAHLGAFMLPGDALFSECGTADAYLEASVQLLARRGNAALVDPSAHVAGAVIAADCVIGARAEVAPGVTLRRSIVWPDTRVTQPLAAAIAAPDRTVVAR